MKYIILLWTSIILIIFCFLFLPYGYSRSETTTYHLQPETFKLGPTVKNENVEWIYLDHQFMLNRPSSIDSKQSHNNFDRAEKDELIEFIVHEIKEIKILWHIVFIELFCVLLISGGFLYTFKWHDNKEK